MTREFVWAKALLLEMRDMVTTEAAKSADVALAEYDKRFPPPTLDAAMDKAADEEIGKLRALVLKGGPLMVRLQEWVCREACDHTVNPSKHHPDCVDARQWLADCRAAGLE